MTRPEPSSEAKRRSMSMQRTRDTGCEIDLRRQLHRLGLRYRVHRRPVPSIRREADVVFTRTKVAVFVDGCFWHGCPVHGTWPMANAEWWRNKIERNRSRDVETDEMLRAAGWIVVRVWEHEDPAEAAARVAAVVAQSST